MAPTIASLTNALSKEWNTSGPLTLGKDAKSLAERLKPKHGHHSEQDIIHLVNALDVGDQSLCHRLDAPSTCVILAILLDSEPCLAQERGICLLATSIHFLSMDTQPVRDEKSRKKWKLHGFLLALFAKLVSTDFSASTQIWIGILAIEILSEPQTIHALLKISGLDLRTLGRVVTTSQDFHNRWLAGAIVLQLHNHGVAYEILFEPHAVDFAEDHFPKGNWQHIDWIASFAAFAARVPTEHGIAQGQVEPLCASSVAHTEQYTMEVLSAILIDISSELNIIVPPQSKHAAIYIRIPLENIVASVLIPAESSPSQTEVALPIDLKSADKYTLLHNAGPRHESRILLGFESRKMAMQTQRVLKIMMQQASSDDNVIIYESIIDINNEGSEDAEDPLDYIPDSTGNDAAGAIQMSQVSASRKEIAPVVEEEKLQSQSQRLNSPQRPRSILQSYIASGNAKDNEAFRDWPVSKLMKPNDNDDDTETTDENGKGDGVGLVAQKKTEDGTTEAEKHLRIEGSTSTHDIDASRNPNARPNVTQQPSSKDIQGKQDANKDPPAQRQVNPTNQPSKLLIPATDTAAKIPKLSSKSALASSGVKMPGLPTLKQTKMPSLIDAAKVHNIRREESMLDELADEQMLQVRRSPPLHTEGPKRPLASKNTASNKLSVQETLQPSKSVRKESDLLWDEGLIPEDNQLEKQPKASNQKGNQSKKRSSKGDAADKTMTTKPKGSRARPSQAASKPKKTAGKPIPSPVRKVTRAVPKRNAATKANKQMEEQIGSEAMADVKALNQMSQEVHRVHPSVSPQSLVPNSNGDKAGERNDETPQQHFSRHSFPHSVDNDQNRSLEAAKLHNDNIDGRRVVQAMAHSALVHLGGSEVEEDGHEPIHADDQLSDCPKDIQPGRISSSDNHNDMKVHQATPEAVEESHPIIADSQVQAEPSDHKAEKEHTQKITKPNSRPVRNDELEEDGDLPERWTNDQEVTLTDNAVKETRPQALESAKPVLAAKSTNAEKKRIRFDSQQLKDRNKEWGTGKGVVARLQGNIPKTESRRPAETMSKHTVLSPKDAKASTNKDDEVEQPDAEIHKKETLSTTPPKRKSASALQKSAKKRPKEEHQKTARIMQKSDAIVEKTPNPDPNRKAAIIHFDTSGPRNQGRLSAKKPARPVKTSKQIRKLALPITQEPNQDLQKLSKELSKEPPRELPIELLKEISPASPFAGSQPPLEDGFADDYIPMAASTQSHSSHRIGTTPQRLQIAQVDQELDRGTPNMGHNSQLNASKTLIPTQKEFTKTRHRDTAQEAEEFWNPQVDEVLQAKVLTQASTFIHSRSNSQPQVTEEGSPIHPSQVRSQVRTTMEITSSMPSSSPYSSSAGNPSHFFVDHEKPNDSADVPTPKSPMNSTKSFLHVQKENAVPGETITERLIDQDPTDASKHKVEATKDIVRTPLSHRHQQTPKSSSSMREILQVLRQVSSHLAEQQKIATESKKKRRYASRPVTPAMDQDTTLIEQPASPRRKRQKQARFDSSNSSVSIVTPQRKAPAKPFDARMQPRPRSENKEQNKMVLTLIQICRRMMERQMQSDKYVRDNVNRYFRQRNDSLDHHHREFQAQAETQTSANTEVVQDLSALNTAFMNILNKI